MEESQHPEKNPGPAFPARMTRSQSRRAKKLENTNSGQSDVDLPAPAPKALSSDSGPAHQEATRARAAQSSALRSRARKSDLLQVYRNERKSAPNPNSVAFTYVDTIVDRLIGSGRTKHEAKEVLRTIVQKLAKYDEIFERFLDYAEDSAKRHFSLLPFSRVCHDNALAMGVRLEPALTFGRLAQKIEESRIPNRFNYKDRSSIIPLDYTLFSESDGTRAFLSKVEANARTRISGLVSELVDKDFVPRAILMGEHLSLGNLGTKTPPVEIKHMKPDGSIHSTFLSGTLDYICCSSHSENSAGIDTWDEVMMKWKTKNHKVPDKAAFERWELYRFWRHLEQSSRIFDNALASAGFGPSRWESLVIEAKCMRERITFTGASTSSPSSAENVVPNSVPGGQGGATASTFSAFGQSPPPIRFTLFSKPPIGLFALDPDKWLNAHDTLKTLLPSGQLNGIIVDRYLLMAWSSLDNESRHARYIPLEFLYHDRPTQETIARFRAISGLPSSGHCPPETVIGVIMQEERYRVVVVIPSLKSIYLFGQGINGFCDPTSWKAWEGQLRNIGIYHGWDTKDYLIYYADWPQDDSRDRALFVCQVVESILADDFDAARAYDYLDASCFPCAHNALLNIGRTIYLSARIKIAHFSTLYQEHRPLLEGHYGYRLEGIEERIQEFQLKGDDEIVDSLQQLKNVVLVCEKCIADGFEDSDASGGSVYHTCIMEADADSASDDSEDSNADYLPPELTRHKEDIEDSPHGPGSASRNDVSNDLVNRVGNLAIYSDGPGNEGQGHEERSNQNQGKPTEAPPQTEKPSQRSLLPHVYQAVAECLAIYTAIDSMRQKNSTMKFCVSSSNDWLFGLIDCSDNIRPCYITDTLTVRTESDAQDMILLLLTWIHVPADQILESMKEASKET